MQTLEQKAKSSTVMNKTGLTERSVPNSKSVTKTKNFEEIKEGVFKDAKSSRKPSLNVSTGN